VPSSSERRVRAPHLKTWKAEGRRIAMLTAYDAVTARLLERAGVFALVLESIPHDLAKRVTAEVSVPTIGIGAGPHCDGQVLVTADILGLYENTPPFAKVYAQLGDETVRAVESYIAEVRGGHFPEKTK